MRPFLRQLRPAVLVLVAFTVVCGVVYPLLTTLVGQAAFGDRADGSLIRRDGVAIGSELIGQAFSAPEYFHSRPSAAGAGYDGAASSGSNLGPLNPDLLAAVEERAVAYRAENGLVAGAPVPVDAVTASGSGLDPHISVANARLQVRRVADERSMSLGAVLALVDAHTDARSFGVLGEPGVNVVRLNVALDDLSTG
jgi:potassium-transporting ATPase KdpC subunit